MEWKKIHCAHLNEENNIDGIRVDMTIILPGLMMINLILQQDVNNQVLSVNLNVLKEMKHLEIIYMIIHL